MYFLTNQNIEFLVPDSTYFYLFFKILEMPIILKSLIKNLSSQRLKAVIVLNE